MLKTIPSHSLQTPDLCCFCLESIEPGTKPTAITHSTDEKIKHVVACSKECLEEIFKLSRELSGDVKCPICRDVVTLFNDAKVLNQNQINLEKNKIKAYILRRNIELIEIQKNLLQKQLVSDFLDLRILLPDLLNFRDIGALNFILNNMKNCDKDISEWIFFSLLTSTHLNTQNISEREQKLLQNIWIYLGSSLSQQFSKESITEQLYVNIFEKVFKGLTLVDQYRAVEFSQKVDHIGLFFVNFPELVKAAENPNILKTILNEYKRTKKTDYLILFIESYKRIIATFHPHIEQLKLDAFLEAAIINHDQKLALYLLNNFPFEFIFLVDISINLENNANENSLKIMPELKNAIKDAEKKKIEKMNPNATKEKIAEELLKDIWTYLTPSLFELISKEPLTETLYLNSLKKIIKELKTVHAYCGIEPIKSKKHVWALFEKLPQRPDLIGNPDILNPILSEYTYPKNSNDLIIFIEFHKEIVYSTHTPPPKINLNLFLEKAVINFDPELSLYLLKNGSFSFIFLIGLKTYVRTFLEDNENKNTIDISERLHRASIIEKELEKANVTALDDKIKEIVPKITTWTIATLIGRYFFKS